MEIVIKSIDDVLTQMNANELLKLRERLNGLNFVSPNDLVFGCYRKYFSCEPFGWMDGNFYSKTETTTYSEILLYNTVTKCDALTGENLDKTYQTLPEESVSRREIYVFNPSEKDGVGTVTLLDQAKEYGLSYQDFYLESDSLKLLELYNFWVNEQIRRGLCYNIIRGKEKIVLPYRQYEKTENGVVRALRPLQYF